MRSKFHPRIISEYLKGTKMAEISKKWGLSEVRIRYHLRRLGIPPRVRKLPESEIVKILKEYKSGKKKIKEIEKEFNVSGGTIFKYARKHGIKRNKEALLRKWAKLRWKNPDERKRISELLKGRKFSKETLKKMRYGKGRYEIPRKITKDLCYVIGVCLGDAAIFKKGYTTKKGYVTEKFVLRLTAKDKDFVLKFKNCLQSVFKLKNLKISKVFDKKYQKYYYQVRTQKREIVDFILKKISNLKWLKNLSKSHKREVLRGMFDSDGSVSVDAHRGKPVLVIRFGNKRYPHIFEELVNSFKIKYKKYVGKTVDFHFLGKNALRFYKVLGGFTIKRKNNIVKKCLSVRRRRQNEFVGN